MLTSLLLGLGTSACGSEASATPSPLEIQPALLQLDSIPFGGRAQGAFLLRNRTKSPLLIRGIGPTSCDCAILDLTLPDRPGAPTWTPSPQGMQLVLASGERAQVNLQVDTARYRNPVNWKTGRIPIILEEGYAALDWALSVWVPYWLEPWARNLQEVGIREQPVTYFLVEGKEVPDFELFLPEETDGWRLSASRVPLQAPVRWRVDVLAPPELPEGPFEKIFSVQTSVADGPNLSFRVFGVGVPDLSLRPQRLLLRPDRGDRSASALLRCRDAALRLDPPRISLSPAAIGLGSLAVETLQEGSAWRILFHLNENLGPLPKDSFILVETNHPETPQLRLSLHFVEARS